MSWVKLDDGFIMHRKVMEICNDGLALQIAGMTHCARNLTDGFISDKATKQLMALRSVGDNALQELLEVGLWEVTEGGYLVHDYLDYNPSKEEAEQLRDERAEAGKIGGIRSGEVRRSKAEAKREANALANPKQNGSKNEAVPVPVPVPVSSPVPNSKSANADLSADGALPEIKTAKQLLTKALARLQEPKENHNNIIRSLIIKLYGQDKAPDWGYVGTVAKQVGGHAVLANLAAECVPKANGEPLAYCLAYYKARKADRGSPVQTLRQNIIEPEPDAEPPPTCEHIKEWSHRRSKMYCPKCDPEPSAKPVDAKRARPGAEVSR